MNEVGPPFKGRLISQLTDEQLPLERAYWDEKAVTADGAAWTAALEFRTMCDKEIERRAYVRSRSSDGGTTKTGPSASSGS